MKFYKNIYALFVITSQLEYKVGLHDIRKIRHCDILFFCKMYCDKYSRAKIKLKCMVF